MGAWGYGVQSDDTVSDVKGDYVEALKNKKSKAEATGEVIRRYLKGSGEPQEAALVWLGLAAAQWDYGSVDPEILDRIRRDLKEGHSVAPFEERDWPKRRSKVEEFIAKVEVPNPKPKKQPKKIARPALFAPGDCLSIRLKNGKFGAALILATDNSDTEYGRNLVATLDYMESEKPDLRAFETGTYLKLTHRSWNGFTLTVWKTRIGFRTVKDRVELVGTIPMTRPLDLAAFKSYSSWQTIGEQIVLQRNWDEERKAE